MKRNIKLFTAIFAVLLVAGVSIFYACDKNEDAIVPTIADMSNSEINNYDVPKHDYSVTLKNDFFYSKTYGNAESNERDWRYINLNKNLNFFAHGETVGVFSSSDAKGGSNAYFTEDLILEKIDETTAALKSPDLTTEILFKNIVSEGELITFDLFIDGDYACRSEMGIPTLSSNNFMDMLPFNISKDQFKQAKAIPWAKVARVVAEVVVAVIAVFDIATNDTDSQPKCKASDYDHAVSECARNKCSYILDVSRCYFYCDCK